MTAVHPVPTPVAARASTLAEPLVEPRNRPHRGDVLVAVGEDDLAGALRYAVTEALARSAGVHLVHVVRVPDSDGVSPAESWHDAVTHGHGLLSAAADRARELGGTGLRVTLRLIEGGSVTGGLVEQGDQSGVVVLQHRHLGHLRRVVTHSVTRAVAAHLDAPVVSVPDGWVPGPVEAGCVVVGVQDLAEARPLVARALDEASQRGLPLWIVHAGRHQDRDAIGVKVVAEDAPATHPSVRVHLLIKDSPPERLLANPMTGAELVILGRRHGVRPGTHLGPVARAVLDESACPVMLVRHGRQSSSPADPDPPRG